MLERDLDLSLIRRSRKTSVYAVAGAVGGTIVVLYILGYLLVDCLTTNAYEDHMISTVYPTKEILKDRVRMHAQQFPEKEQKQWQEVFLADDVTEEND